jgi:DNA-binding transcriptional LysR family regulator
MPDILARFADSHPETNVEISRGASCELVPKLKAGELDLMLCEGGIEPRQWPAVEIWRGPLEWITSDAHNRSPRRSAAGVAVARKLSVPPAVVFKTETVATPSIPLNS